MGKSRRIISQLFLSQLFLIGFFLPINKIIGMTGTINVSIVDKDGGIYVLLIYVILAMLAIFFVNRKYTKIGLLFTIILFIITAFFFFVESIYNLESDEFGGISMGFSPFYLLIILTLAIV
ncbi:MAG: hypothetical protein PHP65_03610, partial [Bacilli bacterium]|nr:hypothetical protein [Bacilli bacterium]